MKTTTRLLVISISVCLAFGVARRDAGSLFAVEAAESVDETNPLDPKQAKPLTTSMASGQNAEQESEEAYVQPWDYLPYRVLVWVVSDDPKINTRSLEADLRVFLDRDFASIWQMQVADAPVAIATEATRRMSQMSYQSISAADPVLVVKRNHLEANRLRVAANVGQICKTVYSTKGLIEEVSRRAAEIGNETIDGVKPKLTVVEGGASALAEKWSEPGTEAMLLSRGAALELPSPTPKLIELPISGLVIEAVEQYDKIFVCRISNTLAPITVNAIELDTLMRQFSTVSQQTCARLADLPATVGRAMVKAFQPMVRIEEAGTKTVQGLVRAAGLIASVERKHQNESPAMIRVGDVLRPMLRKNDRNDQPIQVGPIEWAYLVVTEQQGPKVKMDVHQGRPTGLQGRKNHRIFKMGLKVRPVGDSTLLRLHAQGDVDFPLIGYEIYDRNVETEELTFVGRTDWNGRLNIERSSFPMRLLYVKNGGALLARLPMVPGLLPVEVADLTGDDLRLQAEAYIRGVQNAIIDLVAIRQLFAARIRSRLRDGQMREAEELLAALLAEPTNEKLSQDMGRKQTEFLKALPGPRNAGQRRKVDNMFTETREILSKHINPKTIRDLEADLLTARNSGGRLPASAAEKEQPQVVDTTKPAEDPAPEPADE